MPIVSFPYSHSFCLFPFLIGFSPLSLPFSRFMFVSLSLFPPLVLFLGLFLLFSLSSFLTFLISRIQGYLLVKVALRFLSRIPKIYVDPRGIARGVPP